MHQYIIKHLFKRAQPMRAIINTGGGYHLGGPNMKIDLSQTFPSSILHNPLVSPPGFILN
jgi:hypothetical protein